MKHILSRTVALALACLALFAIAGCASDKSAAVEKAFTKENYNVVKVDANNETAQGLLKILFNEEQIKKISTYEIMLFQQDGLLNSGKSALVIKFPSSNDLKDFFTVENDGKKDTSAYDEQKEKGNINGNCLIITLSDDSRSIFKKA